MKRSAPVVLSSLSLPADEFVTLLGKLIGEAERLQNNPSQGLHPREELAADHVLARLRPYSTEQGGPLKVEKARVAHGARKCGLQVTFVRTPSFVPPEPLLPPIDCRESATRAPASCAVVQPAAHVFCGACTLRSASRRVVRT